MNYIADFMCKELRLIIEVDGITHDDKFEEDKRRTNELNQAGFWVARFTDNEVLTNIQGVAKQIEKVIRQISPPPCPPSAGDKSEL